MPWRVYLWFLCFLKLWQKIVAVRGHPPLKDPLEGPLKGPLEGPLKEPSEDLLEDLSKRLSALHNDCRNLVALAGGTFHKFCKTCRRIVPLQIRPRARHVPERGAERAGQKKKRATGTWRRNVPPAPPGFCSRCEVRFRSVF